MILSIQIYSLLFSFGYGIFFAVLLFLFRKVIFNKNLILMVIFSFLFVFLNVILYFWGLKAINNGILHIYFFLSILLGYCLTNVVFSKLLVKMK